MGTIWMLTLAQQFTGDGLMLLNHNWLTRVRRQLSRAAVAGGRAGIDYVHIGSEFWQSGGGERFEFRLQLNFIWAVEKG
jgi:hypothetical protein